MSKSFGSDEIGITDEDRERIDQFNEYGGVKRRENVLRGNKKLEDELNRDESYMVSVLVENGHFPKFLADELDVDKRVVEYHYENECHDYSGSKMLTLAECHEIHQDYDGENLEELAEWFDMSEAAIKYHLNENCNHDKRVINCE